MKRLLFLAVWIGVSLPAAAHAESAPPRPRCSAQLAPSFEQIIPLNAPSLVLLRHDSAGLESTISNISLSPAPTPITFEQVADPRQEGATLLLPSRALAGAAEYTLTGDIDCKGASTGLTDSSFSGNFKTGASVQLPTITEIATVRVLDGEFPASEILIAASPELVAYLPLTRFDAYVAGALWSSVDYGNVVADRGVIALQLDRDQLAPGTTGRNLCPEGETGVTTVEIEIRPHVAGAETDPRPVSAAVPIDCRSYERSRSNDAGPDDPGANSTASGTGGCATGARTSSGSELVWILGAAVMAIAARLQRSRRARSRRSSRP